MIIQKPKKYNSFYELWISQTIFYYIILIGFIPIDIIKLILNICLKKEQQYLHPKFRWNYQLCQKGCIENWCKFDYSHSSYFSEYHHCGNSFCHNFHNNHRECHVCFKNFCDNCNEIDVYIDIFHQLGYWHPLCKKCYENVQKDHTLLFITCTNCLIPTLIPSNRQSSYGRYRCDFCNIIICSKCSEWCSGCATKRCQKCDINTHKNHSCMICKNLSNKLTWF